MTISYPSSLDSFPNPQSTDLLDNASPTLDHWTQHANANDAIEALEAKVGADGSAVTTSFDYKLNEVTGTDKAVGKTATQTLTNKTLTSPVINVGSDATGDMYYRNSSGVLTRMAIGASGTIISSDGTSPQWISNPSGSDASTTVKGVVELGTYAETIARTTTGGTGAKLVVTPDNLTTVLTYDYQADSVGTDSYAITCTPAPTAYTTGMRFTFKAGTANTGACSLNVNSLGAKTIKKNYNTDLATGDILANQIVEVVYDGTNFQLVSAKSQDTIYTNGITSRTASAASGSQTISHGLSSTPKFVRITAFKLANEYSGNVGGIESVGVYNGTTTSCVYLSQAGSNGQTGASGTSSTNIINIVDNGNGGGTYSQVATISVDATNITLSWTYTTGSGSYNSDIQIMWEAQA